MKYKYINFMIKDINLLSISHSFVKKINLKLYSILNKFDKTNVHIIIPNYHKEDGKTFRPDFNIQDIELNIYLKNTIFNHLRFKFYQNLLPEIKKNSITHVILDQDLISLQSIILLIYSYVNNVKIFYFSNENSIIDEKNLLKKNVKKLLYKLIYFLFNKKINKIFCYSNQIKTNLDDCGLTKITQVIPLGYDDSIFYKTNSKINNSKFVISYFGRVSRQKGIKTLIKSLTQLNIENWEFQIDLFHIESLSFFSEIKSDLKYLQNLKKLKIIKPTHLDIAKYMQRTNLTIVPSEWNEQYGRVIQESAACGSIVLGSNIGAIPEIIKDKEFIFEPKNTTELVKKIENIFNNYREYKDKFKKIEKEILEHRTAKKQAELIHTFL